MLPMHTILHPTDFSEHSAAALRLGGALARDHGARLVLLHVVMPPTIIYGEGLLPPEPGSVFRRHASNSTAWTYPSSPSQARAEPSASHQGDVQYAVVATRVAADGYRGGRVELAGQRGHRLGLGLFVEFEAQLGAWRE